MQGLQQQGVGAWKQLQAVLPHMSLPELQFYTRYLLCSFELDCYLGWRPTQCVPPGRHADAAQAALRGAAGLLVCALQQAAACTVLSALRCGARRLARSCREQVFAERQRNQRTMQASGCRRNGVLGEDDKGSLEQWYRRHPKDRLPGPGVSRQQLPDQSPDKGRSKRMKLDLPGL